MVVHEPSALEEQDSVSEAVTLDDNTKAKLEAEICSLKCENAQLKSRVQQLQTTLQRLDPRFLSPSQLQMYTGLGKVEFGCLASWLLANQLVEDLHHHFPHQLLLSLLSHSLRNY